jgi:hypothetical protein
VKLPKKVKIGGTVYSVHTFDAIGAQRGRLYPHLGRLEVATSVNKKPRSSAKIAETFWHETTHAVLYDMVHPLWVNENFTTDFSTRLAKAINSARFE